MSKTTRATHPIFIHIWPPYVVRKAFYAACTVFVLAAVMLIFGNPGAPAHAATSSTLNFQARLLNSSGGIVPDGYYNVEFKLYSASSGGSALWTDTRYDNNGVTAGQDYRLRVVNGYFSVNLADTTAGGTAFPGSINWDQELWLTMNIGGSTQTATPTWDGEMTPRIKLTSVPYAFRAGAVMDGSGNAFTADQLAQLAPSGVQSTSSANTLIRLNQTGAGGLLQLQSGGSDVFTVSNSGVVTGASTATFQGATVTVGTTTQSGSIVLNDGSSNTLTISTASLGQNTVLTIPDPGVGTDTICLQTLANCAGGGGGSTLQSAYTASTGGTTPEIKLDSTRAGLDIQDADATISGNLIAVRASNAGGLGSVLFSVNSTGQIVAQNSSNSTTAFQIQNSAGTSNLFVADTTNSRIGINKTSPGYSLDVNGLLATNSGIVLSSTTAGVGRIAKVFTVGTGGVTTYDVVIFADDAGNGRVMTTTTARDSRVVGIAVNNASSGQTSEVAVSGTFIVTYTGTAPVMGDQLVTSTVAGAVMVDNNATTGIVGVAISNGSAGTVSVSVRPISGQYAPIYRNATDSATAFQVQNASGTSYLTVDTSGGRVGIGNGTATQTLDVFGTAASNSAFYLRTSSSSSGLISKDYTTLGVSQYDVVVLSSSGGSLRAATSTTARDNRVLGISSATVGSGSTAQIAIGGNYQVNVATAEAITIGDQLVVSSVAGQATVDNNATTGIIGYAAASKSAGVAGPIAITIRPYGGQFAPIFRNASDAADAFRIQNSSGSDILNINSSTRSLNVNTNDLSIDGTNNTIGIGAAATVTDKLYVTTSGYVGLRVNQAGISDIARFQDNGTTVASIADGGAALFQNSTNSTTAFQIQNAAGTGNTFVVDTTNGAIGINSAPAAGIALGVAGQIASSGASTGLLMNTLANTTGNVRKLMTAGTGGTTANAAVVLDSSGQVVQSTTPRDNKVFGVALSTVSSGSSTAVAFSGTISVLADASCTECATIAIGDQLVISSSSGRVTANNSATTGILGYALSTLASGTGTVNVSLNVTSGQYSPVFRNASDSSTAFQIQNAAGTGQLTFDTSNGNLSINQTGSSGYSISTNGSIGLANTLVLNTTSNSTGRIAKSTTVGAGGVSANDVVVLNASAQAVTTTTARDTRVYGVALSTISAGSSVTVAIGGNTTVNYTGTAPAIGDQLVTSTVAGSVMVDNGATTGILGTAASAGSGGTVSVSIRPVNGQYSPVFRNASNSTTAFQIQNATGNEFITADSTNAQVVLGKSSTLDGKIKFLSASNTGSITLEPANPTTSNYTLTLPAETGTICTTAASVACAAVYGGVPVSGAYLMQVPGSTADNTVTPTANSVVGLTVNGTSGTAATAVNILQGGAATGLAVTSSNTGNGASISLTNTSGTQTNGLVIDRNGAGGTSTNLLTLSNTAGTATSAINISGTYGSYYINATNFSATSGGSVNAANGYSITGNTTGVLNKVYILGTGGGGSVAADDVVVLVNESSNPRVTTTTTARDIRVVGVVVSANSTPGTNTYVSIAGVKQTNYTGTAPVIGDQLVTSTVAGSVMVDNNATTGIVGVAASNGSGGKVNISLGITRGQTNPDFGAGNLVTTGTYNTNTFTSSALQFGASSTATIQSAASQALTLTSNAAATWSTSSGNLTLQAAGTSTIAVDTAGAGTATLGATNATTVTVGNTTAATQTTIYGGTGTDAISLRAGVGGRIAIGAASSNIITLGSTNSTNTLTLGQSTATNTINIGSGVTSSGNTQTINIGSGAAAGSTTTIGIGNGSGVGSLTLGSTGSTSATTINAGSGGITLGATTVLSSLGSADTNTVLCRNSSNQIATCTNTGGDTLQSAYDAGNSITTTNGRDVSITLSDTAVDPNFIINMATGTTGKFAIQSNGSDVLSVDSSGSVLANNSATATTATTSGTGTDTTTVTLTGSAFANGDVILIDNAGQDYFTRITSGGGTATLTVSPAVTFENSRTVTKYNVQNIGASSTGTSFSNSNRYFQGFFLGGVVTGAGSTTYSDGRIESSNNMTVRAASSVKVQNSSDNATAFSVQSSSGINNLVVGTTAPGSLPNLASNGSVELNTTGWSARSGTVAIGRTSSQARVGTYSYGVTTNAASEGANYSVTLSSSTQYTATFFTKVSAGSGNILEFGYSSDGSTETTCKTGQSQPNTTGWRLQNCTFTTGTVSGSPYFFIRVSNATARNLYIDGFQIVQSDNAGPYGEGTMQIDGLITSAVGIRTLNDTNSALSVQAADGTGLLSVDTNLKRIGLGLDKPTSLVDISGIGDTDDLLLIRTASATFGSGASPRYISVENSSGTSSFNIDENGYTIFRTYTNNATSFQVQNSSGTAQFSIDTTNGNGTFVGDVAANGGDVTSTAGLNIQAAATSALGLGGNATSGTVAIGAAGTSGTITIGQSSSASNTINIGAAMGNTFTQTINIGTSATAGSTTTITIGSTIAGTTTIRGAGGITLSHAVTASSTLAVTGNTTLTGDIAVNGGDITSTAATLTINAGGTVDIQDAATISGALTLQGGAGGTGLSITGNNGSNEGGEFALTDGDNSGSWQIDNFGATGSEQIRFFKSGTAYFYINAGSIQARGDIDLISGAARTISVTGGSSALSVLSGSSTTGGGDLTLEAGNATSSGNGGEVNISAGYGAGNERVKLRAQTSVGGYEEGLTVGTAGNAVTIAIQGSTTGQRLCHSAGNNPAASTTANANLFDCTENVAADFAEFYDTDGAVEVGDVVEAAPGQTKVRKTNGKYDSDALGVISTNPTYDGILGFRITSPNRQPVGLAGRVPVKVSLENGPIVAGDYLTAGTVPGTAMKLSGAGHAIGIAMEDYDGTIRVSGLVSTEENDRNATHAVTGELPSYNSNPVSWPSGVGKIMMFMKVGFHTPNISSALQGSTVGFDNINVGGHATVKSLEVTEVATVAKLIVNGHIIGNPDTRGTVVLGANTTQVVHTFDTPFDSAPTVVASPVDGFATFRVESTSTNFTIFTSGPAPTNIKFNYLVQQ